MANFSFDLSLAPSIVAALAILTYELLLMPVWDRCEEAVLRALNRRRLSSRRRVALKAQPLPVLNSSVRSGSFTGLALTQLVRVAMLVLFLAWEATTEQTSRDTLALIAGHAAVRGRTYMGASESFVSAVPRLQRICLDSQGFLVDTLFVEDGTLCGRTRAYRERSETRANVDASRDPCSNTTLGEGPSDKFVQYVCGRDGALCRESLDGSSLACFFFTEDDGRVALSAVTSEFAVFDGVLSGVVSQVDVAEYGAAENNMLRERQSKISLLENLMFGRDSRLALRAAWFNVTGNAAVEVKTGTETLFRSSQASSIIGLVFLCLWAVALISSTAIAAAGRSKYRHLNGVVTSQDIGSLAVGDTKDGSHTGKAPFDSVLIEENGVLRQHLVRRGEGGSLDDDFA